MAKVVRIPDSCGDQRSRAARIIEKNLIIAGSIVEMVHTCGKSGCKCALGDKHVSPYLAVRRKGKRSMLSIPRNIEMEVRQAVSNYKELMTLVDALSTRSINDIVAKKKRGA
jgi:hypothetical protein